MSARTVEVNFNNTVLLGIAENLDPSGNLLEIWYKEP